jgi:RHS repeat-associated protein
MAGGAGFSVRRRAAALVVAVVTAGLTAGMAPPAAAARAAVTTRKFVPPKAQKVPVLPRTTQAIPVAGAAARQRVSAAAALALRGGDGGRPDSAWPSAATGTAVLPAASGASPAAARRATERPAVALGVPVTVVRSDAAADAISQVHVRVLSHTAALAAGVPGVLLDLASAVGARGRVRVSLGYASFRNAGGADWAGRLRLAQLPGCALTTPHVPACQVRTPLATVNDTSTQTVSASTELAPAAAAPAASSLLSSAPATSQPTPELTGSQVVLAAVSGPSGSNGDFTATSLRPAGTWAAGGSSGNFTWSYPITLPPPAAGSAPQVSLDYDSANVDGKTAQTNNQSGVVGEGFTLSDNYVERTYTDCADDPEGAISGDYDNCWAGNVVALSLDGHSTQLVQDSSTGTWHEESDSGDRVQYLTGTATDTGNGTYDNGYWVVTTPDGTQYFFGKNKGPGWASGDPVTNSAWTGPVYGAHSGDPCYSSAGFADSSCSQAWRWNLDFVIDPDGNTTAYYYTAETNYYGADNKTTGVQYDRGGYLTQIDYGLRDENNSIYGNLDTHPADEVLFNADQRCIPTSSFSCSASDFTSANAQYWPDTPQDQQCLANATCNNHAPTFWSQMRIDSVTTQYYNGSGYTKVDTYALGQSFPAAGDPELELDTITRTGYSASGSSITLPQVKLTYQLMNNRVPGYNSEPDMAHWRLTNIETETGEVISVTYSSTCAASDIPSDPSANTTLCYPIYWTPVGDTSPILDYFNKYVVQEVSVTDGTAGDPSQVTEYQYAGSPAWHYDDNQVVKAKYRTYGQFRGYGTVAVLTGDPQNTTNGSPDVQTEIDTTYYRGMDKDTLPGGGTSSVQVSDSLGEKFTDSDALAGLPLEVQAFDGAGGTQISDKITQQEVTQVTGSEPVSGLPALQSSMTGVANERDYTDIAGGGQQVLTTATTYDSDGRPVLADKSGTGIPETCTQTSYDDNTSAWIRNAVSEQIVARQACPSSPGNLTANDIISDTRTYYDGAASLATPPTVGNPTQTDQATANNGGTLTWRTAASKTSYDSSGRARTSTDGRGNVTTTAYTPTDGGPLTAKTVTNALSQTSATTYDPGRGSLLTSTDVAGYETSYSYDPLGRVTGVWKPGRSQSGGNSANITYSYLVTQSAPLAVTTSTLVDTGAGTDYVASVSLYDSLGQLRQTQTAAEGGDTTVTDKFYDSHGWVWKTFNRYVISGSPSATIVQEADSAVSDRTIDSYDGAGRMTGQQDYNGDTLTDSSQTVQGGNQVTTIHHDPAGDDIGTPTATVTNVLGQKVQTIQYAGQPTVSSASVVSGGSPQVTTATYDAAGNTTKITDPDGNTWSYGYDLLGEQVSATDPDTGTRVTGYDAAGNVAYATDANGTTVNYTYDSLNRKTAAYTGSATQGQGTKAATWVWDTWKKGRLGYETRITPGGTYETGYLGYDTYGTPAGTFVVVPSGQPLAGQYKTGTTYSSIGLLIGEAPAAGGGLLDGTISYSYDQYGNPVKETGYDVYVSNAIWTPYNEISQIQLGTGPSAAALTYTYDPQTRDVTGINLSDFQPSPQVDNTAYSYNADRQITSITDTQGASGSAPAETQCFSYDGLSRLTQAWTATDNCAANPASAGNATVNGPQPYWQSWTFDSLGDILTQTSHATAGSAAGDTTASYSYGVSGHAHAAASVKSVNSATSATSTTAFGYDHDGNTTSLGGQSLTWNYDGTLASAGATSYVYDADGNELAKTTASGTTLYLPGEQLTVSGGTVTGMRYYTFGGVSIGESTGSVLYWTQASLQGTLTAAVSAFAESSPVIYRTFTPYGSPVAGSGSWPDDRAFLNDPATAATGLTDVGARKYDPATGLFVSVDPVLDPGNPQTMTGYTYAAGDPVNNADPTGLMVPGGSVCTGGASCNGPGDQPPSGWTGPGYDTWPSDGYPAAPDPTPASSPSPAPRTDAARHPIAVPSPSANYPPIPSQGSINWLAVLEAVTGYHSAYECFVHGSFWGCLSTLAEVAPVVGKVADALGALNDAAAAATAAEDGVPAMSQMERVGSGLKGDLFHRSVSWVVDNPAAQKFAITGGDGVARDLYQLPGELNGKPGVYEWIVDRSGSEPVITHQRFIPGGSLTGGPNQ